MFSAWPVHGEGESKKVDVTVAHRKVLLADAEHTTNLQKILGNCKIILFYWCYSFHQSDQSWQVQVKRFPKFRNSKETSAGLQMERWERERPLQSKMYVKPVRVTRNAKFKVVLKVVRNMKKPFNWSSSSSSRVCKEIFQFQQQSNIVLCASDLKKWAIKDVLVTSNVMMCAFSASEFVCRVGSRFLRTTNPPSSSESSE